MESAVEGKSTGQVITKVFATLSLFGSIFCVVIAFLPLVGFFIALGVFLLSITAGMTALLISLFNKRKSFLIALIAMILPIPCIICNGYITKIQAEEISKAIKRSNQKTLQKLKNKSKYR